MFEQTLSRRLHIDRHRTGPYAAERRLYLSFLHYRRAFPVHIEGRHRFALLHG